MNVGRWLAQGRQHLKSGRLPQARAAFEQVLAAQPDHVEALCSLGRIACQGGQPDVGLPLLNRALTLAPEYAGSWLDLGRGFALAGHSGQAQQALARALALQPNSFDAHYHLGVLHYQSGQTRAAMAAFLRAVELDPRNVQALNNLALAQRAEGQAEEARITLTRVLRAAPDHFEARANLGAVHDDLGQHDAALEQFTAALKQRPETVPVLINAGIAALQLNRVAQAEAWLQRAATLAPNSADARFNLGLLHLHQHRYAEGWQGYAHRWNAGVRDMTQREFGLPRWQGESLAGKTLLVPWEQGLGDEIMFASIVPELIAEADHVVLECSPKLHRLFSRSFPAATVVPIAHHTPDWATRSVAELKQTRPIDIHCAAGDLPGLRRNYREAFPAHHGYLRADPARITAWRARLDALGAGLKVGISWRGGTARSRANRRSIPLVDWQPLLRLPGVQFVSLQYTECADDLATLHAHTGGTVHHWQHAIDDYDETAALVGALDLVVSVCTAVIHLGGALGKPVWVLAPVVPEWRYGLAGESMPWYPSVRVLRQTDPGDWRGVLETAALEVAAQAASHVSVTQPA